MTGSAPGATGLTRAHAWVGVALLALAAWLGWHAARLTYSSSLGPGPGFFPRWLCVALACLALVVIAQAFRAPRAAEDPPAGSALARIAMVVAMLALTGPALDILGFRAAMAGFCLAVMVVLGCRSPAQIAIAVLLGGPGAHLLFAEALGVALPAGRLGL
jgi:putative tricarboxylic transport membrane protein